MIKYYIQVLFIISLAIFYAFSLVDDIEDEWSKFKLKYSKKYENHTEDLMRMNIFKENRQKIAEHNEIYEKGLVSYQMALNKFADWTNDEFVQISGKIDKTPKSDAQNSNNGLNKTLLALMPFIEPVNATISSSIDWRKKGAVSEVKDQGHCGSCWTFAATGALEGQYFLKTGQLLSLSEQNILDCSTNYVTHGCNGGFRYYAFQYVKDNGGINTEESYPYDGSDDNTCRFNPKNSVATVFGMVDIPEGNETALVAALATVGPVSVSIDATHYSFRFYSSGIYFEPECMSQDVNGHAVLAVGYNKDYYIVKNSWGEKWGEGGYIRISRNKNHCGIATSAIYPLIEASSAN
ncbi:cathepsin L1-like [Contarinia nasturtii]|uniref:cathepsin L1-like n=1 Tax=Contarinia nasturtii TaxID=265458 RepID=UPI0012D46FD8|nr:cathepsin L1-like [Contarinia nasturtii]